MNAKTKICSKCKIEKPLTLEYFRIDNYQANGFTCRCRLCLKIDGKKSRKKHKAKIKKWKRRHYLNNRDSILSKSKEYSKNNRELVKIRKQKYAEKNKEQIRARRSAYYISHRKGIIWKVKEWTKNNKDKRKKYIEHYMDCNPSFRIACSMRSRLRRIFKSNGGKRCDHTKSLLGCSWTKFKIYIESLFVDGMTWKNYGKKQNEWSIDHIRPCSSFNLMIAEEQRKCFHYRNTRPLWNKEQWSKNSYYKGQYVRKNNAK